MTKNFILSEKETSILSKTGFEKEDVKEFIRLLKDNIKQQPEVNKYTQINVLNQIIDKLAGKKLI